MATLRLSRQVELYDDDVGTLLAVDSAYGMQPPIRILSLHPLLPLRLAAELSSPSICGGVHLTAPIKPAIVLIRHPYEIPTTHTAESTHHKTVFAEVLPI